MGLGLGLEAGRTEEAGGGGEHGVSHMERGYLGMTTAAREGDRLFYNACCI